MTSTLDADGSLRNLILVNGGYMGDLSEDVVDMSIEVGRDTVSELTVTLLDDDEARMTRDVLVTPGAIINFSDWQFESKVVAYGDQTEDTVTVVCPSTYVQKLKDTHGEKSWGTVEVSDWAQPVITGAGAKAVVQPGLGQRQVERKGPPEGAAQDDKGDSDWDVLVEQARQVGAWLFEHGKTITLARPSWIMKQTWQHHVNLTYNSRDDHSDTLVSGLGYRIDHTQPEHDRESLTVAVMAGDQDKLRTGGAIHVTGKGAGAAKGDWIIDRVVLPLTVAEPVELHAVRPIDPPIVDPENTSGMEGGTAGVPAGPLGSQGWDGVQLENAAAIVREGQARSLPKVALQMAVACSMQEASLKNKGHGDEIYGVTNPDGTLTTSLGLFQQQQNWGSRADRLTPTKAAGFFYTALTASPYEETYNNGGVSLHGVTKGQSFGPGKSAAAASVAIHNVQVNNHALDYEKQWADAIVIVDACITAGSSSSTGGKAEGPMGAQIDKLMASYEGMSIDVDGAGWMGNLAQCVDLAAKFITDLLGIPMVQANGKDYWRHPGLMAKMTPIPASSRGRKGDVVSWSGSPGSGPYANWDPVAGIGYGHVALVVEDLGGATIKCQTQNPTPATTMNLSRQGVLGFMRPK